MRRAMRQLAPIDPGTSRLVTSQLFVWMSGRIPGTVAAFLPMRDEADLTPLFDRLPGWRWVLPRVEPDRTLTFRDRDVPVERHEMGMDQPADHGPATPLHEIDIVLVPGLAFDETGARLGRGVGYYDKVLAGRRRDCVAVGVTVEARVIDEVPVDEHDQSVDWIATEAGVSECLPRT